MMLVSELSANRPIALTQAKVGCELRVRELCGPEPICHRLREMGFCEQARLRKISDSGNLICSLCGSRMALNREIAASILVELV